MLSLVIGAWSLVILVAAINRAYAAPPLTGSETEKRFPPLVVPEGFHATLFACDPLIEYPSAIAVGPKEKAGSLLVAIDYMTGLGTEIVRRDEIRLIEDTDRDGYADKSTLYADGFNSIMGLTFHGGTVYVMHAPLLTSLKDTDGDGKADERRDLLTGLGLPPEQNDVRLHCANGLVMGHDGWLYLALGDHGCDVPRPEGDRLVYHGGGILRCRRDGRDLHLFASGLRNIYDVALDDELNVFVRDNENDGGEYKIRVCYSFHGADHGYPYLYYERPDEALPPLADLGLGSSAGGAAYLEKQFPAEYRGSLFFCEWGKSVVSYRPQRTGGGFAPLAEIQFATGAANDPYGFKPTDLVVDRDGSLVVADWCDGQRPKRGRGRIYRIVHTPPSGPAPRESAAAKDAVSRLDSPSYFERDEAQQQLLARGAAGLEELNAALAAQDRLGAHARMHAVWILAADGSPPSREKLFELAERDSEPRVQVQAVRALADLYDPVLGGDKLDAPPADARIAERLAALAGGKDPRVLLEIVIAVGRLTWVESPEWLRKTLAGRRDIEPLLAHAAMQTLRRSGNWPLVLVMLDLPSDAPLRPIALRAIAGQHVPEVADGLIECLVDRDAQRRREYADALTRIWKQPGPWTYWGYRPGPRPVNTIAWAKTAAIESALDQLLASADDDLRLSVLKRMQREQIPPRMETLAKWLTNDPSAEAVAAILESLAAQPVGERRGLLRPIVADRASTIPNRLRALELLTIDWKEVDAKVHWELARTVEDGPVLVELLAAAPDHIAGLSLAAQKLGSPDPLVRAASVDAVARIGHGEHGNKIIQLLSDAAPTVRRAAAEAAGRLKLPSAVEPLLPLAADADPQVRAASLTALRQLEAKQAVPLAVAALEGPTQLAALECIAELGGPDEAQVLIDLANQSASEQIVSLAVPALAKWSEQADLPAALQRSMLNSVSEMQGRSGLVVHWRVCPPMSAEALESARRQVLSPAATDAIAGEFPKDWRSTLARGPQARVSFPEANEHKTWLATADVLLPAETTAQFLASATGTFRVWLNGKPAYERKEPRPFAADSDRFDATLAKGLNRIVVQVSSAGQRAEFHLRFRRKSSAADIERLVQAALAGPGDAERGRSVFLDTAKAQCSKCHRIESVGERVGPELTGLGDRFSRMHIIESILEPSRTVTAGFQTILVRTDDGQTITGIKLSETERQLVLADQKGDKHTLAKALIEEQMPQTKSLMPDNLGQQLSQEQFVDLVTFLVNQKKK